MSDLRARNMGTVFSRTRNDPLILFPIDRNHRLTRVYTPSRLLMTFHISLDKRQYNNRSPLTVRTRTTKDTRLTIRQGTIVQANLRRRDIAPAILGAGADIVEQPWDDNLSDTLVAVIDIDIGQAFNIWK